jgi:DNA polymerase I
MEQTEARSLSAVGWEAIYVIAPYKHIFRRATKKWLLNKLKDYEVISLDTEGKGDIEHIHTMSVDMLQIGTTDFQCIIDTRYVDPTDILECLSTKLVVGHNIKYDWQVIFLNYGIKLLNVYDTMLACQIRENGVPIRRGWFTLDGCTRRYVDPWAYSNQTYLGEPFVTKKVREGFHKHEGDFTDDQILYGAKDVYYAYALYLKLGVNLVTDLENRFCIAVAEMELTGMPIDGTTWEEIYLENKEIEQMYLSRLKEVHEINWNSHAQIKPIFKELGFDLSSIDKETGELKDTINAKVIEKYISTPLISDYLNYKKYQKMCSTYGLKFLKHVSPVTGRIHTSIHQLKDTGRTSSTSPNLQNIKRDGPFRAAFKCPEGYVFVGADYSSQEVRILAELSNDSKMIEALNSGGDFHLQTAKIAFNDETLTKESEERQQAKSITFLLAYGGGPSKLAQTFGISIAKAKDLVATYLKGYSDLEPYFKLWGDKFRETGSLTISDFSGRQYHSQYYEEYLFCLKNKDLHPKIADRLSYLSSKMQRLAQNYRIQGLAAEMSKLACIYMRDWSHICQLALMVHDELIVICKKEDADLVSVALKDCMERAFYHYCKKVKIKIDVKTSEIWKK